jgi:hypothetical protein
MKQCPLILFALKTRWRHSLNSPCIGRHPYFVSAFQWRNKGSKSKQKSKRRYHLTPFNSNFDNAQEGTV